MHERASIVACMQRGMSTRATLRRDQRHLRLLRNTEGPQPSRPAVTPRTPLYSVRVRNTDPAPRGEWGTYVRTARERRGLGQAALARLLGVDRATIYRWESKQQRPENVETVVSVAQVLALDVDEALGAAGLRVPADVVPAEPYDEELELVRTDPNLDPEDKVRIVDLIIERRERERSSSLADTRRLIELMRQRRREAG